MSGFLTAFALSFVLAFLFGYLCGSIPFGLILTKLAGTQDLRKIGSGNIGATNVLRTGNKGLAAATLLGDMLKGTVAVIVAGYFGGPNAAIAAGVGAFVGQDAQTAAVGDRGDEQEPRRHLDHDLLDLAVAEAPRGTQ